MSQTRKRKPSRSKRSKTFKKTDYASGDGMLTTVWGPSMWHYLHTMSFNYPVKPTEEEKRNYKDFMLSLQHVLPCRHCRENLKNNYKAFPLQACHMASRDKFSRYVYRLHETINKMLGKKSGLKYCDVRERYEHFRARCTEDDTKIFKFKKKEKGCTEPLYGKKAKCVIKIVPHDEKCPTLTVDKKCIKKRTK
jgi:hypothetical protein